MEVRDRIVMRVLRTMADTSRLRMLRELCEAERCVTELATASQVSQSCATRHLQALERAGLVASRRAGKRVVYRLAGTNAFLRGLVLWAVGVGAVAPAVALGEARAGGGRAGLEQGAASVAAQGPDREEPTENAGPADAGWRRDDMEDYLL